MWTLTEPVRAVAFIDGQNLFHGAKEAFGHEHPSYDVPALVAAVSASHGWQVKQIRFYTGVPAESDNLAWNRFWAAKLGAMGHAGVYTFTRLLRYRNQTVRLPNGRRHTFRVAEEKGIDVRIALDIVRMAHRGEYDVALVFSQDQDLSEVADEIRTISKEQQRWIKMASAFPVSPSSRNRRGINGTDWIRIDRPTYDSCLDPRDYRPKPLLAA